MPRALGDLGVQRAHYNALIDCLVKTASSGVSRVDTKQDSVHMTLATENAGDIVWPDEEHLFAADNLSSNDRAVSHGSERGTGLDGGTDNHAEGNDNNFGATATEISDANEFWDHDDRTQNNGNLR